MVRHLITGIIILFTLQTGVTQVDSLTFGLKGKIIRALSSTPSSPSTFYAGLKGSNLGTALVYKSEDTGKTWHPLNNGKAISPYSSDIQAIAVANDKEKTIYAGTWKEGLFVSRDHGQSWSSDKNAPSSDIRSIKTGIQNPSLVYAATSTFGVMKSTDAGKTWQRNEPETIDSTFQFAWSVEIDESNDNICYAQTFNRGVWKSIDQGTTWQQILPVENKVCWDMKVDGNSLWLAASKSRDSISVIQHSIDGGMSWKEIEDVPQVGINQINVFQKGKEDVIIVGSWSGGIHVLEKGTWKKRNEVDYDTISEILINGDDVLIGSWGNGLYQLKQ